MFSEKLETIQKDHESLLCVGLDPVVSKMPDRFQEEEEPLFAFNQWIIDQTCDSVCAYKPNSAFYEAHGAEGIWELKLTCEYLQKNYPSIPIILDAKRGDIGHTNAAYATFAFSYLGVDAITLQPYLGREAVEPFLEYEEKGCIFLCRTSNAGAGELQDLRVLQNDQIPNGKFQTNSKLESQKLKKTTKKEKFDGLQPHPNPPLHEGRSERKLWEVVAERVSQLWNVRDNCLLVIGATYPEELAQARELAPKMTFLVPGVGVQGGLLEEVMEHGLRRDGLGLIINTSRSVIYADEPREAVLELVEEMRDAPVGAS